MTFKTFIEKPKNKIIVGACAVVLLAAGGFGAYGLYQHEDNGPKTVPDKAVTISKIKNVSKDDKTSQIANWRGYQNEQKHNDNKIASKDDLTKNDTVGLYKYSMSTELSQNLAQNNTSFDFYIPYPVLDKSGKVKYIETSPVKNTKAFDTSVSLVRDALKSVPNIDKNTPIHILYGNEIVASTDNAKAPSVKKDSTKNNELEFYTQNYNFTDNDSFLNHQFFHKNNIYMKNIIDGKKITLDHDSYLSTQTDNSNNPIDIVGEFTTDGKGSVTVTAPYDFNKWESRDREQFYYQIERALAPFVYESKTFPQIKLVSNDKTVATSVNK